MEKYDRDSLESLVHQPESFNKTTVDFLIHFVKVFEIYPSSVWQNAIFFRGEKVGKRLLRIGANHPRREIRVDVASNTNTPISILKILAKDEDINVKSCVAGNPNTPISILELLAKEESWIVRVGLARNLNTPISILEEMGRDEMLDVRWGVARNSNAPLSILKILAKDESRWTRDDALNNLDRRYGKAFREGI